MHPHLSLLPLLLASTTAAYVVPNPPGKYNVTLTIGTLTDYTRNESSTRNDSSAGTPRPRELLLSVFQPSECTSTVAATYMPNKTAEFQGPYIQQQFNISYDFTPYFLDARFPVCSESKKCSIIEDAPILLFSGGWAGPRTYYNAMASAIASEGFTVITIDYPGDTNIITYPDGHVVYGLTAQEGTPDAIAYYTNSRVVDGSFILDQLSNATAVGELLPQRGPRAFCTDRVGMMGHSLGGAVAVQAAGQDPRVRGAIDVDGAFYGSVPSSGISTPVMYMISQELNDVPHPTLDTLWPKLKGPKLLVEVANSTHFGFTDAPVMLQAAGQDPAAFADLFGTIAPHETLRIVAAYTTAWMKGAIAGKVGGPLLEGKEPHRFPETKILKKKNY